MTKQIKAAQRLYDDGFLEEAEEIADRLVEQHPDEAEVWLLRGTVRLGAGRRGQAVSDMSRAIDLRPTERLYYFYRAFAQLQLGAWHKVVDDCTNGLSLSVGSALGDEYYREVFHLFRAEALISLGERTKARSDVLRLADEGRVFTNQMRSKQELLALCE